MKMEYVANIRAELNGYPGPEKLILKQGDFTDRYAAITLTMDGSPVQIGAGVSVQVNLEKPDGTQVMADENIEILEDGTLKVQILPQMSAAAGSGHLEVALYRQGALLSTAVIDVLIYPSAISMVKVASSNEYQVLIDALAQIAPAIDAEEERKQAEILRNQNEATRQQNETLRENATSQAIEEMDFLVEDIQGKLERGEFRGDSGVVVPISGLFTLSGDEDGNLYAYYADGSTPPQFEVDDTGNIYYITPDN